MDDALIYGYHATRALLEAEPEEVTALWLQDNRRDARSRRLAALAGSAGIPVQHVPRKSLDAMLPGARHQGVILRTRGGSQAMQPDLMTLVGELREPPLLLVLDGVQDPHNLGACLRTASAAGAHAVVAPRRRAVGLTPAVRKVASGGAEAVPYIQVPNLAQALRALREAGVCIVGTDAAATVCVYDLDLTVPLALVLGGEANGLRRLTREHCDHLAKLPMQGAVESLNVSVAAGVCLYEVRRQRGDGNCATGSGSIE